MEGSDIQEWFWKNIWGEWRGVEEERYIYIWRRGCPNISWRSEDIRFIIQGETLLLNKRCWLLLKRNPGRCCRNCTFLPWRPWWEHRTFTDGQQVEITLQQARWRHFSIPYERWGRWGTRYPNEVEECSYHGSLCLLAVSPSSAAPMYSHNYPATYIFMDVFQE